MYLSCHISTSSHSSFLGPMLIEGKFNFFVKLIPSGFPASSVSCTKISPLVQPYLLLHKAKFLRLQLAFMLLTEVNTFSSFQLKICHAISTMNLNVEMVNALITNFLVMAQLTVRTSLMRNYCIVVSQSTKCPFFQFDSLAISCFYVMLLATDSCLNA